MQNIIKLIIKGDVLSYLANYVKNTYYYLVCSIMLDPKKTNLGVYSNLTPPNIII